MNKDRVKEAENLGGFQFVQSMKAEGKIRHIGFSFHDKADVLDEILTNHPEMEFVQLQINYYDWESENVQSRKCYEVAEKHGVPVIVMEPVKGGTLANMVGEPARILSALDENASYASYAVRYAASLPNVILVLSGMSDLKQLQDNTAYMKDFQPLTDKEQQAIGKVVEELENFQRFLVPTAVTVWRDVRKDPYPGYFWSLQHGRTVWSDGCDAGVLPLSDRRKR